METIKKTKQVEYEMYRTADGKEFENKSDALFHEDISSGKKKVCDTCKGTGRVNARWEKEWQNMSMCPTDNKEVDVMVSEVCMVCKGKKYLEQKWV